MASSALPLELAANAVRRRFGHVLVEPGPGSGRVREISCSGPERLRDLAELLVVLGEQGDRGVEVVQHRADVLAVLGHQGGELGADRPQVNQEVVDRRTPRRQSLMRISYA